MISSQGRIQTLLFDDTAFTLSFTEKTLTNLRKYENILQKFSLNKVIEEDKKNENRRFSLKDLSDQFSMIEEILEVEYTKKKHTKNRDQLKVALEYYKLAIMQTLLHSLLNNEDQNFNLKPSLLMHGIYGFLFMGGTWIAYLHGYDAANAISGLFPYHIPKSVIWGAGSFLFLIALGLFSAFEADALSKHMGFKSIKNLKTTLDIHQHQIEVTHDFMKQLGIHSENKIVKSAKQYARYVDLAEKFDNSIAKTKARLSALSEPKSRKILKASLLIFGMAFSAADEVFLTIGFGALLLSGPWGWVILGVTALIGAVLFYAAFHNMIRDKVTPTLKQKEEILEKYQAYQKDHLFEGIKKRLEVKKYVETLETRCDEKENKIHQLESQILAKEKMLNEKNKALEQFKKLPEKENKISLQKFSHFKPAERPVFSKELSLVKLRA